MSLSRKVYRSVREGILDGEYTPGMPLVESKLARDLGVSRTPVREALRRLSDEGLVTLIPGQGAQVSQILYQEVLEVQEIRELLEPYAARRAAVNVSAIEDRLREIREDVLKLPMADTQRRRCADRELHDLILEGAGNETLRKLVSELRTRTERAFTYLAGEPVDQRRHEHLRLVDAILAGDPDAAEEAMREHLSLAKSRLMEVRTV